MKPFVLEGADLTQPPPDSKTWTTQDMFRIDPSTNLTLPTYTMPEVAKIFFGRSTSWIHYRNYRGEMILDGINTVPPGAIRKDGKMGMRYLSLYDVERIIEALITNNCIDGMLYNRALRMLDLQLELWGYK